MGRQAAGDVALSRSGVAGRRSGWFRVRQWGKWSLPTAWTWLALGRGHWRSDLEIL